MKTHTQAFKNEIKEYGRQFNDIITYTNTSNTRVTLDESDINKIQLSYDSNILKSQMKKLVIDSKVELIKDDVINYQIGLLVNSTYEYLNMGDYIVTKIEEKKDTKSYLITCYDKMLLAMQDYESLGVTYSITIRDYISALCTKLGLTFHNASDTFTNYDKEITSEHYLDADGKSLGYTYRDVLDDLAEVVGGFIIINSSNELEIKYINEITSNKNLLNLKNGTYYKSGIRVDVSNNKITIKGRNSTAYTDISIPLNTPLLANLGTMTKSLNATGTYSHLYTEIQGINSSQYTQRVGLRSSLNNNATGTLSGDGTIFNITISSANTTIDCVLYAQVELGTNATSFEPYYETIDEEYFNDKNVNIKEKYGPINSLVTNIGTPRQDASSITQNGLCEIQILDNPILDQTNGDGFLDNLFNRIKGIEYYLNDFQTKGILYYELGDKYNVSIDNNVYSCLMLNDEITRTTGLKENIYTKEPKVNEPSYKYENSLERTSRNAYIMANKAEGKIEQVVTAVGDNGEVTSASIIQSINNDTSQIKLEADKIDLNGAVTANNNFIINQDGSVEVNSGYITLTDTPSDPEDRFIIWASDKTSLMSATSEYVLVRSYDENNPQATDFDYAQISKNSGVSWKDTTDSNNATWGSGREDVLTLSKKTNGVTTTSQYRSDGATINGKIIIPQDSTKGIWNAGGSSVLRDWNGAVTLDGGGGDLYVGHQYTQNINFLDGKMHLMANGDLYNKFIDLFQDTTGTDWKNFLKNKIDYCIANINTSKLNCMAFINGGWSGMAWGLGVFSKIGGVYQLVWYSGLGTYYCIIENNTYSYRILSGNNYETYETIIGKWIDGKPIYRRSLYSFQTAQGQTLVATINDLETMTNLYGTYKGGGNNLPPNIYVNSSNYIRTWIWNGQVYVDAQGYVGYWGEIIVEYTKTTD